MLANYFPYRLPLFKKSQLRIKTATKGSETIEFLESQHVKNNDVILVGNIGDPTAQLLILSNKSGNVFDVDKPLESDYHEGQIAQVVLGDKINIYRSSSKDGTYNSLPTPQSIDPKQRKGIYFEDSNGSLSEYYYYFYYNSATVTEVGSRADIQTFGDTLHFVSLHDIVIGTGRTQMNFEQDLIKLARKQAEDYVVGSLMSKYTHEVLQNSPLVQTLVIELGSAILENLQLSTDGEKLKDTKKHVQMVVRDIQKGATPLTTEDHEEVQAPRKYGALSRPTSVDTDYMFTRDDEF